jgi:hypothetical protein
MSEDDLDPKGLIREAYRIEGITPAECRSIFVDWALGGGLDADHATLINRLLKRHAGHDDHPMTAVLRAGLEAPAQRGRRGGRAGRLSG